MKNLAIALLVFAPFSASISAHASGTNPALGTVAGTRDTSRLSVPLPAQFADKSVVTPSEFAPADELQMTEETFEIVGSSLVGTVENTATIVVLVPSQSEGSDVQRRFAQLGGDAKHLRTWVGKYDSLWYQDYGPIYSIADGATGGTLVANDFVYGRFGRRDDDSVPSQIAALEGIADNPVTLNYEGGNFISDGKGTCLASSRIYQQNPQLSRDQVDSLMKANLGCARMVILTPLEDDDTYHIDLFAKLLGEKTILVGDFVDHPANKRIMDDNSEQLAALGYQVVRVPVRSRGTGNYLSSLNSFTINGYALIPAYDIPEDQVAAKTYQDAGYKPILIPAEQLEDTGGAIHCILRSRPKL